MSKRVSGPLSPKEIEERFEEAAQLPFLDE